MELCKKKRKSDMQKAEVKVKLVTDTYMLQYHQDKFSQKENAGFCKICKDGVEDIEHFILKCKQDNIYICTYLYTLQELKYKRWIL
jgi:hypothetical protein